MKCNICGEKLLTTNVYKTKDAIYRYRKCNGCNKSFRTVERIITNPKLIEEFRHAEKLKRLRRGKTDD